MPSLGMNVVLALLLIGIISELLVRFISLPFFQVLFSSMSQRPSDWRRVKLNLAPIFWSHYSVTEGVLKYVDVDAALLGSDF